MVLGEPPGRRPEDTNQDLWFYEYPSQAYYDREGLGTQFLPSRETVTDLLLNYLPDLEKNLITDEGEVVEAIKRTRKIHKAENLGRAQLAAQFLIDGIYKPMQKAARESYAQKDFATFVIYHDISTGIKYTFDGFMFANLEKGGDIDAFATGGIQSFETAMSRDTHPVDYARLYLAIRAEAAKAAGLLETDPTGMELVDAYTKQIHAETRGEPDRPFQLKRVHPYLSSRLVHASSGLTQRAYTAVYPLVAGQS